jgi:magnesium-protoporphyrin IX monomethyl ester (oxidative) cyclase
MERLRLTSDAIAHAKAKGGLLGGLKRFGLVLKAGATLAGLFLLPVDKHPLPADVRMEPTW